jgi:uridine kinase
MDNPHIKSVLFIKDDEEDNNSETTYRHSTHYFKKVSMGLKCIDPEYDLYFIIRSDFIFENIDFLENIEKDVLYFSLNHKSCFTKNVSRKINEQIMVSSNYRLIQMLVHLYDYSKDHNNYADIILHHFIQLFQLKYKLLDIQYKIILSKCNIIAISGDSGSGKTTLMKYLKQLFIGNSVEIETDRYHKWERGDENYKTYTHLNPFSNHLEVMSSDIYNLKIGNDIFQVDYDHDTGKFTKKEQIVAKDNVIICGLHTLYNDEMNKIVDLKIFMDTERELMKKWKIQRDISKRGYSVEQITKQIADREADYYKYIDNQKQNADVIIRFYESENTLCKMTILNKAFFQKISPLLIELNYPIIIKKGEKDEIFTIELLNNYKQIIEKYNNIYINWVEPMTHIDKHNYYSEILAILMFYIS